jgi:hypothetical protein
MLRRGYAHLAKGLYIEGIHTGILMVARASPRGHGTRSCASGHGQIQGFLAQCKRIANFSPAATKNAMNAM